MHLDPQICYQALLARDVRYDGKFFVCVRTTRIYCRPICPTHPPKFANCFFVPTAAAAHEAGCRPCIRCRPESSPDTAAWSGTSAVVSRALRLIEDGALDTLSVPELANRIGLGERHVRRLFAYHLGASPLAVAQTRRILLAKQLIHETTLSMTEVAFASGFGSVRRFNETFQKLFQRAPMALRKASTTRHSALANISLLLSYRPPYDWDTMLRYLSQRMIPNVEAIEGQIYRRAVAIDGMPGLIHVHHRPDRRALQVDVDLSDLSRLSGILERIRRLFDLRSDPATIDGALMRNVNLAALVERRPGIRVPGAWSEDEIFLWTILEARGGPAKAKALMGAVATTLGKPISRSDIEGITHTFPESMIGCDVGFDGIEEIPSLPKAWMRETVTAIRRRSDVLWTRATLADTLSQLLHQNGHIVWAEEYLAMRMLHDVEAYPVESHPERSCSTRTLNKETLENCHPWLAYAAMHLWIETSSFGKWQPALRWLDDPPARSPEPVPAL